MSTCIYMHYNVSKCQRQCETKKFSVSWCCIWKLTQCEGNSQKNRRQCFWVSFSIMHSLNLSAEEKKWKNVQCLLYSMYLFASHYIYSAIFVHLCVHPIAKSHRHHLSRSRSVSCWVLMFVRVSFRSIYDVQLRLEIDKCFWLLAFHSEFRIHVFERIKKLSLDEHNCTHSISHAT